MNSITIGDKTYEIKDLPTEGQQLARQASATSDHIRKLEARLSIARTAQASYVDRLKAVVAGKG